jgi:hypothetical protein
VTAGCFEAVRAQVPSDGLGRAVDLEVADAGHERDPDRADDHPDGPRQSP